MSTSATPYEQRVRDEDCLSDPYESAVILSEASWDLDTSPPHGTSTRRR
jgi:hypothetical protein